MGLCGRQNYFFHIQICRVCDRTAQVLQRVVHHAMILAGGPVDTEGGWKSNFARLTFNPNILVVDYLAFLVSIDYVLLTLRISPRSSFIMWKATHPNSALPQLWYGQKRWKESQRSQIKVQVACAQIIHQHIFTHEVRDINGHINLLNHWHSVTHTLLPMISFSYTYKCDSKNYSVTDRCYHWEQKLEIWAMQHRKIFFIAFYEIQGFQWTANYHRMC